jgi:hypothetical protein
VNGRAMLDDLSCGQVTSTTCAFLAPSEAEAIVACCIQTQSQRVSQSRRVADRCASSSLVRPQASLSKALWLSRAQMGLHAGWLAVETDEGRDLLGTHRAFASTPQNKNPV